jgi:hypothetical protein
MSAPAPAPTPAPASGSSFASASVARRMRLLVPAAVVLVLSLAARHWMVEPTAWSFGCQPAPWSGWCSVRTLLLATFRHGELGWFALIAGIVAVLSRSPRIASLAVAAGCAGLVLYSYEPAAAGALLGLLVIARGQATAAASASISAA